jgi:hypothetical protein
MKTRPFSIYFILGLVGIFAAVVGFSRTFFIPLAKGSFVAPLAVHVHGAFAFAWIIFYCVQTWLIRQSAIHRHRSLGWLGAFIAVGIAVTMIPAGMFQVQRDLRLGLGETAVSALLGVVTSALMFTTLVALAFYYRKKRDVHKALMLIATIFVLWPAWFRFRHFFPSVPRPDIWFGLVLSESLIVIALIVDYFQQGKPNRTMLYAGGFVILETTAEVLLFDSAGWRVISQTIYAMLL